MEENTRGLQEPTLGGSRNTPISLICRKNVSLRSCEDMTKAPLDRTFWFIRIVRVVGVLRRSTHLGWESSPSEQRTGRGKEGRDHGLGLRSCCTIIALSGSGDGWGDPERPGYGALKRAGKMSGWKGAACKGGLGIGASSFLYAGWQTRKPICHVQQRCLRGVWSIYITVRTILGFLKLV